MRFVLDVVYLVLLLACSPWFAFKAWKTGKYRSGFAQKFLGHAPVRRGDRPCVWLHGVSVGEINLLGVLIQRIEKRWPDVECVISTTTQTGFELAAKKYGPRQVFFCPLDFSWAVRNALQRVRPSVLVLAELELWPNLLMMSHQQGVRTIMVNGRLGERSARGYQRVRPWIAKVLEHVDRVCAQNDEYASRFQSLGANAARITVTGSLKFDGAESNRENPGTRELRELWGISTGDTVFLAGSTTAPEESMALEVFARLERNHPELRLVLVPRHPERFAEVATLLAASGLPWQRRSSLHARSVPSSRILLVDTVGELRSWWGLAHVGFVGGSFGARGGQSMIEPAAYGVVTSFGPNTHNFREVVEMLLGRQAARVVRSTTELIDFVQWYLDRPSEAEAMGRRARLFVASQFGATEKTIEVLATLMANAPRSRAAA